MQTHQSQQSKSSVTKSTSTAKPDTPSTAPDSVQTLARNIGNQLWQAKLKVGPANDKYEQEADRVADQVVNTQPTAAAESIQPTTVSTPQVQRQVDEDEEETSGEETHSQEFSGGSDELNISSVNEEMVQTKPSITPISQTFIQRQTEEEEEVGLIQAEPKTQQPRQHSLDSSAIPSGGTPLNQTERHYFEPRFGRSLDQVRIHTGSDAQQLTSQVQARAFTVGNHVVFGQGEYQPDTLEGKRLMAHEFTHVFQQENLSAVQRKPLSDEKKQQLRTEASRLALEDLNKYVERISNMTTGEHTAFTDEIDRIQKAAEKAAKQIEATSLENKDLLAEFVRTWGQAFDYEPYALGHTSGERIWSLGGRDPKPEDFPATVVSVFKSDPDGMDIDGLRNLTQRLKNPQTYFLDLLARHQLERILKREKIDPKDYYSDSEEEGGGGTFVSPAGTKIEQEIEQQTGKELSEEEKAKIDALDEETRKLILEIMRQEGKNFDEAKRKLEELSPLELEVLRANQILNEDKEKGQSDRVVLNDADVEEITGGGGMNELDKNLEKIRSLEQSILDKIKSGKGGKKAKSSNFSLLEEALKAFEAEIIMMKGLIKGAARRNPELGDFETELVSAFNGLMEEIRLEMLKSLGTDIAISLIPYVGWLNLIRKIQKIIDMINLVRKVLAIKDEIAGVQTKLAGARSSFQEAQRMIKDVQNYDQEDVEDKIFELIETHNLHEILYLPELDTLPPEEARAKVLQIVRDIPLGVDQYSQMYTAYSGLPNKPSSKELASLGVKALIAGAALSPVVAYLALKILENMDAAKSMVGNKSLWDRITKRKGRKKRSSKDRRKDKQDKSKKKMEQLDERGVEYIKSEVESVISTKYQPLIIAAVENSDNSLGNHSWTEPFFKDFVKAFVKKLNGERSSVSVKAKKKVKKTKTSPASKVDVQARMPSIDVKFKMGAKPWTIVITTKRSRGNASVSMKPNGTKCKEMDYSSFAGTGIPYEPAKITHGDKINKKRKITSWLMHRDQGYQKTYGVDSSGQEVRTPDKTFLRMKEGAVKPGFLRFDPSGYIMQGVDPDAYKEFLGKKLSGQFASRVNTRTVNKLLPPGYHIYRRGGGLIISGKKGAGVSAILNWDNGFLAEGNKKRVEQVVDSRTPTKAAITAQDTLTPAMQDQMLNNMFEKDPTTGAVNPNKVDSNFKAQGRNTLAKWKSYVTSKPDLQMRPTHIEADIGYTINKKRASLTTRRLPELKTSDDKGHLIAARFNGADDLYNLLPMNTSVNQKGEWAKAEHKMAQTYIGKGAGGKHVHLDLKIKYDDPNYVRRPDKLIITATEKPGGRSIYKNKTINNPDT